MEKGERRRGIQSVEIGLRVLDALVGLGKASPLSAIAQASDMSASQAHRYLASLIVAGMAQQDAASGRYDVGPAALRLGLGALARIDAFQITDAAITAYSQRTGRTVQIAALGPLGPTIIRWSGGRPPVITSFNIGSVLPLLSSATGQVFLSYASANEIAPLVEAELASTGQSPDVVEAIRKRVLTDGMARVEGTMIPGLRAAAFPIFDLQGNAILSATALAPGGTTLRDEKKTTAELGEVCRQISLQLGYSGKAVDKS
ncbi:MAG: IclR family transcriptional regulator [Sphingobium sp.]